MFPIHVRTSFPYELPADAAGSPISSQLVLRENGIILGPAHAIHDQIRNSGGGAFSHWNGNLFFSTTNNSDPRENGKIYSIESPTRVHAALLWPMAIVDVITIAAIIFYGQLLHYRSISLPRSKCGYHFSVACRRLAGLLNWSLHLFLRPYGFAAVAITIIIYINYLHFFGHPFFVVLTPDSIGYVGFSAIRTPGYPLLVALVQYTFGNLDWLVPVQLNLLLISYVALSSGMRAIFDSWLVAELTMLLLAIDTSVQGLAWTMMPDAPFTAMVTVHAAMVLLLLGRFTRSRAFLAGLFLVLAILFKPAGYSLLAGIPLLMVLMWAHWRPILLWMGGTTIAGLFLASTINAMTLGVFGTQAFGSIALVGHVAYMIKPIPRAGTPNCLQASIHWSRRRGRKSRVLIFRGNTGWFRPSCTIHFSGIEFCPK